MWETQKFKKPVKKHNKYCLKKKLNTSKQMNSTFSLLKTLLQNPLSIKTIPQTKQLHAQILKSQTHFLSLHKCIITFYTSNGLFTYSLSCFVFLRALGHFPDHNISPSVLKCCTHLRNLRLGESVHGYLIRVGLDFDLYTCNALMNMYAKIQSLGCDSVVANVFDQILEPKKTNVVNLIDDETSNVIGSDRRVYVNLGRELRSDRVRKVFETMPRRDIVSWNTVINGIAQNGMYHEALEMVRELGKTYLRLDSFTLSSVLPIFAEHVDVLKGKEIHGYAIKHGLDGDVYIGSGLIDMYANCTRVEDSYRVFELLPRRDSVSWNAMIAGCVQNGMFDEGLILFREMLLDNFSPMPVSFSSILPACAHLTLVNLGKELHGYIIRKKIDDNVFISSSLVDMYARFGNITVARCIFNKMKHHDIVTCTAMIMGCALHGHAHEAVSLFENMEMENIKPNAVAFVAVLTACSHARLVDEGWKYFIRMTHTYAITPSMEHYAAMADLLGRAGKLEEAYEFISSVHISPKTGVWATLLAACSVHKNINLAQRVAEKILSLDSDNIGAYVALSNTYSAAKMWKGAALLRMRMREKGIRKNPACSWIEIKRKLHIFISGDKSHPCYNRINDVLGSLLEVMENEGLCSE